MELKRLAQEGRQASCLTNDEAGIRYQYDISFVEIVSPKENLPREESILVMEALEEESSDKNPGDGEAILIDQKVSKSGLSGQAW
jgi:hypothetical protein